MSSVARNQTADALNVVASSIHSGWFFALGVLQIVVGIFALTFSFSTTIASVEVLGSTVAVLGSILLIAAGVQIVAAVLARSWRGFLLFLLVGIVYGVAGALTLAHPIAAAEGLTLMLAAALLVGGIFRIVVSLTERFPAWVWALLNGILAVLLGIGIVMQWPLSGLSVLGAFIGIDLVANGAMWLALGIGARTALVRFESR